MRSRHRRRVLFAFMWAATSGGFGAAGLAVTGMAISLVDGPWAPASLLKQTDLVAAVALAWFGSLAVMFWIPAYTVFLTAWAYIAAHVPIIERSRAALALALVPASLPFGIACAVADNPWVRNGLLGTLLAWLMLALPRFCVGGLGLGAALAAGDRAT